jgi:CHAT domain-containing protein
MPSGPVSGVPFDLFRLDERYLAEQYRVLMLMSLSALADPESQVRTRNLDLIFLAGNPDIKREVFNYDQEMSAEIRAVTDIFVGPALHIVQGAALRRDEFQDERFEKADVVHLAIPGLVSLEYPMQSKLMLSGTLDQPGTEFLTPRDFQNRHFNASLAVLSSMRVRGSGVSSLNGYLGFVSDLLQSGAESVVASLWLLEDSDLAGFMDAFYRNLADEPDVSKALLKTRRQLIFSPKTQNVSVWGGFQLYID